MRVREREDAERFYLRQIGQEYPEGGLPADAMSGGEGEAATLMVPAGEEWARIVERHPRWKALLQHHGAHVARSTATNQGGMPHPTSTHAPPRPTPTLNHTPPRPTSWVPSCATLSDCASSHEG